MRAQVNFSGAWRADLARSQLQIAPPQETRIRIRHDEPRLHLSRTHTLDDVSDTWELELTTDGREHVHHRADVEVRSRCWWDGDALVFKSAIARGDVRGENTVRYTLSDDGTLILADERYDGPPAAYHNRWVLVREDD